MVDLAAGEFDEGPRVIVVEEVADQGEGEGVVEGIAAGDAVQEGSFVTGLVAVEEVVAEVGFLLLEEAAPLGGVTNAGGHALGAAAYGIGVGGKNHGP